VTFCQGFEAIRDIRPDSTSCEEEDPLFVRGKNNNNPLLEDLSVNIHRSKTGFVILYFKVCCKIHAQRWADEGF
jgi:hypothetical protein